MVVNYLASFCLGVVLYNFTNSFFAAIPAAFLMFLIICRLRSADITFLRILLYAICVVSGIAYNFLYEMHIEKTYRVYDDYETGCKVTVKSEPYFSGSYASFRAKVLFDEVETSAYVSISGDNQKYFEQGDTLTLKKAVISPVKALNTGTNFNLKDYSYSQKLYLRVETETENIDKIEKNSGFNQFFANLRNSVNKRLRYFFNGNILALVTGMITGDTTSAKESFDMIMSGMGITHVVVVSGSHFAIVLLLLSRFLQLFFIDRRAMAPISVITAILLGAFFGFSASVIRSATVVCVYCICDIFNKERHTVFGAMFITLFGMLIYNPCVINDVSLQLSFASVAGITLFSSKIRAFLKFIPRYFAEIISVSLAANIFTLPIIASCFGKVSLLFLVGNIIITPFVPFIMYGGIVLCILSTVWMKGAMILALPVQYFCSGLFKIFELIFSSVNSELKIFPLSCSDLYMYFAVILLICGFKRKASYIAAAVLISVLCVNCSFDVPSYITKAYEFDKLNFYDNGRTLIVLPGGKSIFIDMSNTVPGTRQIDNNIVSVINEKSRGVVDYYIIMGKRQLDVLHKIENKIKIKNVMCAEACKEEIPLSVDKTKIVSKKTEVKIKDLVLTIVPDKDYNITRVDCNVHKKNIGILRNAEDVQKDFNYILPTVYAHKNIKNPDIKKCVFIKEKDEQFAILKISPGKVMIN
ncbi:MAG: ComEC/Rec2 family competence protein [Clostridia bacterium]|nr:ComEC/Rec2 family competence protein [Clostridia bacterium]